MSTKQQSRAGAKAGTKAGMVARWGAGGMGLAAAAYAATVATAWYRYGRPAHRPDGASRILDGFMPNYEVVDRHAVLVRAAAGQALSAAMAMELERSPVVRAIFHLRERILGSRSDARGLPRGLVARTQALGWQVLAQRPGEEIVLGCVTRPWSRVIVFRSISADRFARFDEPGYVKIVWNLRAEVVSDCETRLSTETRAVATDAEARRRFRWYWSFFMPGIALIRRLALWQLQRDVERGRGTGANQTASPAHPIADCPCVPDNPEP